VATETAVNTFQYKLQLGPESVHTSTSTTTILSSPPITPSHLLLVVGRLVLGQCQVGACLRQLLVGGLQLPLHTIKLGSRGLGSTYR
jgi:hypothetical protein